MKLILEVRVVFSVLCLTISVFVVLVNSPQIMVMFLVVQSFFIAVLVGVLDRVWFSYILFLVFLGGILVIFVYVSRLASWVKVETQYNYFIKIGVTRYFVVLISNLFLKDGFNLNYSLMMEDQIIYLFRSKTIYLLYLFIVGYLLLALYTVCNIVRVLNAPLRKFS